MAGEPEVFDAESNERIARAVAWVEAQMARSAFGPRAATGAVQEGGDRLVKVTSLTTTGPGLYPAKLQTAWTYASPSWEADADAADCYFLPANTGDTPEVGRRYHCRRQSLHDDGRVIYCEEIYQDVDWHQRYDDINAASVETFSDDVRWVNVFETNGLKVEGYTDPPGGYGGKQITLSLIPASSTQQGVVTANASTTPRQDLGAGAKAVGSSFTVGTTIAAAVLPVFSGLSVPSMPGALYVAGHAQIRSVFVGADQGGAIQEGGLKCVAQTDGTKKAWEMLGTSGSGGGSGAFNLYVYTGSQAQANLVTLGAIGLTLASGAYYCGGNQGQSGTYKSVTTTGGVVTGGTATGTGFSGTIGG